ncbi:MAG: hypothetical protein QMD61_09965 [Methanobacterium sp.]|nr:hypothetical protein [Methanobacterium sp.]
MVQIAFRGDKELRNRIKIMAIKKGMKMNELLLNYVEKGLTSDEEREEF